MKKNFLLILFAFVSINALGQTNELSYNELLEKSPFNKICNVILPPNEFGSIRDAEVVQLIEFMAKDIPSVSYTHLRAHETGAYLVCRLLLEKKKE